MGKIVKFIESNLLPLIRALNENTEEGEFTIGMEDNAPVGGEYYHVMDDEQNDISENTIISENSTDRRVNSIIKKYSGVDDFNEIRTIRSKILKLIPNARAKNDMYLGAVAMWYLTGSLNNTSDRFKLNYLLGKLHQGASFGYGKILNEQDFGMVPFNTMKQIIDELIPSEETENSYKSGKKIQKVGNYTIYRMDSYDDTKYVRSQLSQVHWCIFEDDGTFSYMSEGYTVYVCVRDDYENARMMSYDELVEKLLSHGMTNAAESLEENYPKDDMYDDFIFDIAYDGDETAELLFVDNEYELGLPPCDDYGLSMFVVMVSNETYKNGRIVMVYSRYNLPNMFDGGILSESELSNVIGADAMSIFTPNVNVQESKDKKHTNLITESQESKSIAAAKKLAMQRLNYNEQEADEFIRIKLRNDLPALRTPQGGKFILGVTRMFCDGELRSANDIGNLNSTLKLVASDAHINEYDRNLNNLSCQELVQRFAKAMSDNLEAERDEVGQMVFDTPSDYEIVRIDSFEQAEEYGKYVSWCVTHDEDMFNSYTSDGINQFYFCLKNGFENIEEVPSDGCPLDEYGLSMIAVSVNENGMLNTCTCRWNHDNGGDDSIMDTKQVSKVIGMNFFEVFKPNTKWKDLLTSVRQRLENGEDPEDVFNYVGFFSEGFARVDLNDRCNFINQEGEFLSDQWFAGVSVFKEGFAEVYLNGSCNFINKEGRVISDQWFDGSYGFKNGFARVWIDWKFNFINQEGRLLSSQWFGNADDFSEGFARVKLKGKWNFINQEGRFLSGQWFHKISNFKEGLAFVKLNDKWNYINQEGKLLSDQWFDNIGYFHEGFAMVYFNDKWNFINQEGRVISDQWFDNVYDFREGFARVVLNDKTYKIDANGKLYMYEGKDKRKNIIISENKIKLIKENLEFEVDSSEVDLSSFKKQDSLPSIWKDEDTLDSKVRLKLLDIADDFWEFVNVTWVEPKGIIITGSLCNYNWSDYSDVDLHLIVDFNEIGDREDFVRQYLDSKKNEWNEEHGALKIYGYPVELYVQNIDEDVSAGGIYDLEENKWIRKPSYDDIDEIDLKSDEIKDEAARIMTIIDDMWSYFNKTNDSHKLELLGNDADNLWRKIKDMRKSSLEDGGEMSDGNIVYKYMRRKKYLDKLFDLRAAIYDKSNTITESMSLLGESDQSLDLFALAKERFGTTYDIRECGYILPDGSMLDFSGRSSMEKGADSSYLRGGRHVDHRDIYTIGWSEDGNTKNFDVEMDEFIRLGAIRTHVSSSYSLFNLFRKPTKKQADLMMRIIRYAGGCVDVEIGDGYESITSGEYDDANPRRVMSDIIRYFDEGINLMGNVNESITETTAYDKFREGQAFRYSIIGAMIKDGYLFHGTNSEFDEFESDRIHGEERGVYGYGAYFTNAAYKCEEYGNHFTILDSNGFNFLDIEEKVRPEYNIFKEKLGEFSKIEAGLDNARSNREYDYYNNLYDEYRSTVDTELLERFVSILEKNGATDYNTLNKLVDYSFTNSENKDIQKRISQLYLSMGYDGFVCENQFVIFNFDKLNDNIVKDKEKLISKYSIDESKNTGSKLLTEWDRIDYFEKAKEYFGTTSDLNECGFILPDGEMLDLSSSKGRRGIPHRNVEAIGIGLESFIEHGAIRCDSRYKLINICKRPTKEQIIRLVEIIKANNGSVSLDLGNGHVTFDYVDYKNANYKRIINDIINFFDNKIKPSSLYESKNIIKEYLEKDYNLPLYKYFKWASTASSCEKARDLAYSCSYYIDEYIRKIYYRYSEFENLLNDGEFDYEDESLVEMFLNMLEENNLCDHFVSEMQNIVDYYELPSWCTMDFNRIVKNEWCIHFGSDSETIAKEGFTGGTPEIEHLAYTNAGVQKSSAGYDFAFLINDRNVDYNNYGDEAVIFRTSGVEIYHYGDNQNQVVFWGPNVKSFIPIHQDNGDWVVYGQNGQVLVRCGRPSEIALWATENLPQYRKQIMSGKNGYIPTMSYWDENERRVVRKPYPLYRNESIRKYLILLKENSLNEEVVADGNSEHNPYAKRWKAERDALKNFLKNFGKIMTSKENGKQYKVFQDQALSNLIGYNYCICIQWDPIKMEVGSTPYIRAFDKFTYRIFQAQFDDRGRDNLRGTSDDIGNSYQPIQTVR